MKAYILPLILFGCAASQEDSASLTPSPLKSEPAQSAVVVAKTRDGALSLVQESCRESFSILAEGPPSIEAGIALPVGGEKKPNWYIRYQCQAR